MKQDKLGASASPKPALVASDQAASRLAPTGVDPARGWALIDWDAAKAFMQRDALK